MTKTIEGNGVIEFGPKQLQFVPYGSINELMQVRTRYESGPIEELAQAIWTDRGVGAVSADDFDLANPLLIGRHTPSSAKRYITDYSDYYHIAMAQRPDYQDLTPSSDGKANILIAGHRRRRAIGYLMQQHNILPETVRVASTVRDEIEFAQAIGLQLRENVYERPAPQDEARAIDLAFRYMQTKTGRIPSLKQLSTELGFKETKVRDAVAFAALPDAIQEYTNSGALSYTVTRQLKPLYDVYVRYYQSKAFSTPDAHSKAEASVREFCDIHLQRRMQGRSDDKLGLAITSQLKSVEDSMKYQQGSWDFEGLEVAPEVRARQAGRQLTKTALAVMRYRLALGEMSSDEVTELEQLIAAHREGVGNKPVELPLDLPDASS